MDDQTIFHGILTTAGLLAAEHLLLYSRLEKHPLIKFIIGTAAILVGCAVVAYERYDADLLLVPAACAVFGGAIVATAYGGRKLLARAIGDAETRGRLKGLADKGDIADEWHGEPHDRGA